MWLQGCRVMWSLRRWRWGDGELALQSLNFYQIQQIQLPDLRFQP